MDNANDCQPTEQESNEATDLIGSLFGCGDEPLVRETDNRLKRDELWSVFEPSVAEALKKFRDCVSSADELVPWLQGKDDRYHRWFECAALEGSVLTEEGLKMVDAAFDTLNRYKVSGAVRNRLGGAAASSRSSGFVSFDEFMSQEPPSFLVPDYIPEKGIVVLTGASGSGKSAFVAAVAAGILKGSLFEKSVPLDGRGVVFGIGEDPAGFSRRLGALCTEWPHLSAKFRGSSAFRDTVPSFLDLGAVGEWALHAKEALGKPCALVVIDTLSQGMESPEADVHADMRPVVRAATKIRDTLNCTVLLTHHPKGDQEEGIRGDKRLRDCADTVLEFSRDDAHDKTNPVRHLRVIKQKNGSDSVLPIRVVMGVNETGFLVKSARPGYAAKTMGDSVVERMTELPDVGPSELATLLNEGNEAANWDRKKVHSVLARLLDERRVTKLPGGKYRVSA